MSTFHELQQKFSMLKQRKTILEHVHDHITSEFQPSAGQEPKKTLLTDDRLPVSQEAFELETQYLSEDIQGLEQEIAAILGSSLAPTPPAAAQEDPKPVKAKKTKKDQPENDQS